MILFIVFVGVVVVIGIVSNANKNHSKSNEHNPYIHSTNDFSTNDAHLSSQDSQQCADSSATTSDSSCGSGGE